jgi:predicted Zn-dependent protease
MAGALADDDESASLHDLLSGDELADELARDAHWGSPASEGGGGAFGGATEGSAAAHDVAWGDRYGAEEDVDGVLGMLRREGLFEEPAEGVPPGWAAAPRPVDRTRTRSAFALAWGVALLSVAGAFFAWHRYVAGRHAEAAVLREQARVAALSGSHEDLVGAERALRLARDLDPNDLEGPGLLLFVHAERALEDGEFEAAYLRPSIARAERMGADAAMAQAARAVLTAADRDHASARKHLEEALAEGEADPRLQYLAGRLGQRLGEEGAAARLAAAFEAEPRLVPAALALVELRADEGRADEARELLEKVLGENGDHLRARIWQLLLSADDREPAAGLADVRRLEDTVDDKGATTDRLLLELVRASFHRRAGREDEARAAVAAAAEAGASEPRLLARLAEASVSLGRLREAEAAATRAVAGAPQNADFRKLLAEVLLARRDGVGALRTLGALSMDDPAVLRMSAQGALLSGQREAQDRAQEALDQHLAALGAESDDGDRADTDADPDADPPVDLVALSLRLRLAREGAGAVASEARRLARAHPESASALLVHGEAALGQGRAREAIEVLEGAVEAAPDEADPHLFLGRAQRLAGRYEEAEKSLRAARERAPQHLDAGLALGRLLLDGGRFEEADALYQELAGQAGGVEGATATYLGRLGRVEALVGRGVLDQGALVLQQLSDEERKRPSAKVAGARLALAEDEPERAVELLTSVADQGEGGVSTVVVSLLGEALLRAGRPEPARAAFERALAADGGLPEALVGLAEVELAERDPDPDRALERAEAALAALENRLRPPRFRARVLTAIGAAHLADGRRHASDALPPLREAAAVQGVPAAVHFHLGRALEWTGAPADEAQEAYARYLVLEPEGRYARAAKRATR